MFYKHCVIFFIVILCIDNTNAANSKKKLGVMLTKVEPCANTARKMTKNNVVSVRSFIHITGNHSSVIDFYVNITRNIGPVFITLRVFQIQKDDKLKLIFKVDDATCRHPLTFQLIRIVKAPIDKKCIVEKTFFSVKELDMDKFSWLLTKAANSPGKYVYETEYTSENSCVYCSRMTCELYVK